MAPDPWPWMPSSPAESLAFSTTRDRRWGEGPLCSGSPAMRAAGWAAIQSAPLDSVWQHRPYPASLVRGGNPGQRDRRADLSRMLVVARHGGHRTFYAWIAVDCQASIGTGSHDADTASTLAGVDGSADRPFSTDSTSTSAPALSIGINGQ